MVLIALKLILTKNLCQTSTGIYHVIIFLNVLFLIFILSSTSLYLTKDRKENGIFQNPIYTEMGNSSPELTFFSVGAEL